MKTSAVHSRFSAGNQRAGRKPSPSAGIEPCDPHFFIRRFPPVKVFPHFPACPRLRAISAAAFVFFAAVISCEAADGLFAIFQTTRGSFTAQLDYDKAPATVANFVGLVEGTRGWVDTTTGALRRQPFYSGITFHRVVPGFMIQAGSPNGLGTDGPGYSFGDEFHPGLRHDAAGILSMANSGANTNGSQFFITLAPTPELDNKHSVFGRIVAGMDFVNAIGAVPAPVQSPDVLTTIQSITISRVGAAAQAFDAASQTGLPELADAKPGLIKDAGNYFLRFGRSPFSQYFISLSDNLSAWTLNITPVDIASAPAADIDATAAISGKSRQFFRVVKAAYPQQPTTFVNKTLALQLISGNQGNQTLDLAITGEPRGEFNSALPLGTVVLDGSPAGNIVLYVTGANLNNHVLIAGLEQLNLILTISLKFRTPTTGWFTAQDYYAADTSLWPFFGNFEMRDTP